MRIIVVIFCMIGISCAIPINELHSDSLEANQASIDVGDGNEENVKRQVRQVAVNVGPIGVGVGPFGGVGVRVGRLFGLNIAPSYPVAYPLAYPAPAPIAYQTYPVAAPIGYQTYPAAAPIGYQTHPAGYEYSSSYRYQYSN